MIQLAHREETTWRPNRLGTEHILLGVVRADEEAVAKFGVLADRVREEVQALLRRPMSPTRRDPARGGVASNHSPQEARPRRSPPMASQTVAAYMLSRLHRMEQATSMAKALLGGDPNAGASSGNP